MLNCNPAPAPGTNTLKSDFRVGTRTQQRRTCSLPKDGWQTAMDDIHKARHWLCNKGTRKSIDTANNSRPTETETPTQVHQGNSTLHYKQYGRPTTKTPTAEATPDIQAFVDSDWAGCATTRKKVNNRLSDQSLWGNNPLRQQNTVNTIALSSAKAELYAINTGATEALHYTSATS